eukprot:254813_1
MRSKLLIHHASGYADGERERERERESQTGRVEKQIRLNPRHLPRRKKSREKHSMNPSKRGNTLPNVCKETKEECFAGRRRYPRRRVVRVVEDATGCQSQHVDSTDSIMNHRIATSQPENDELL